jgi:formylglycine-generating enzyme required for sulfatase activity
MGGTGQSGRGGDAGNAGSGGSGNSGGASSGAGGRGGAAGSSGAGNGGAGGSSGAGNGGTGGGSGAGTGGIGGSAGSIVIGGMSGSGGSGGARGCPQNARGSAMIHVAVQNGASYCIDRTEVTNGQYAAYLNSPNTDPVPVGPCTWDTTHVPSAEWPQPSNNENLPVVWVDWCDAQDYCRWAGKRLCGALGGGGLGDSAPSTGEWYNACSAGGTRTYPYGNAYSGSACNGIDNGAGAKVAVGSETTCVGGYAGLYDMSGNVYEWDNACAPQNGAGDTCRVRGGSYENPSANLECANPDTVHRQDKWHNIGIRCCADATEQ